MDSATSRRMTGNAGFEDTHCTVMFRPGLGPGLASSEWFCPLLFEARCAIMSAVIRMSKQEGKAK